MDTTVIIIILVCFIPLCGIVYLLSNAAKEPKEIRKRQELLASKLKEVSDFSATKSIEHPKGYFQLAVDDSRYEVLYLTEDDNLLISYDDIIKVDLIENGTLVSSKSTARAIGGALVGGALAGGAGAIVGGLSGDTRTTKQVYAVIVKVLLRDVEHPSIEIKCLQSGKVNWNPTDARKLADEVVDTLSVIIDKVDRLKKEYEASQTAKPADQHTSKVEQLEKLAALKEKGILTEEEFAKEKANILNQ